MRTPVTFVHTDKRKHPVSWQQSPWRSGTAPGIPDFSPLTVLSGRLKHARFSSSCLSPAASRRPGAATGILSAGAFVSLMYSRPRPIHRGPGILDLMLLAPLLRHHGTQARPLASRTLFLTVREAEVCLPLSKPPLSRGLTALRRSPWHHDRYGHPRHPSIQTSRVMPSYPRILAAGSLGAQAQPLASCQPVRTPVAVVHKDIEIHPDFPDRSDSRIQSSSHIHRQSRRHSTICLLTARWTCGAFFAGIRLSQSYPLPVAFPKP